MFRDFESVVFSGFAKEHVILFRGELDLIAELLLSKIVFIRIQKHLVFRSHRW